MSNHNCGHTYIEDNLKINIDKIIESVFVTNPNSSEYRYYLCKAESNNLKCKRIQNIPITEINRIIAIKSQIPEIFDTYILKYKSIPNKVIIE
jgi:hypothetical protein